VSTYFLINYFHGRHDAQWRGRLYNTCFFLTLALFFGFTLTKPCFAANTSNKLTQNTIRVTMDDNYPPYIFRDKNGALTGYLFDLWQLWEHKTGVHVELIATDWNRAQLLMASGDADVIDTIFQTPERMETMDFLPAYADIPVSIYSQTGVGGITSLKGAQGFLIGVKAGDACINQLHAAGITTTTNYSNYETMIQAAIAGKIKLFCVDEPPANYLLYKDGAEPLFHRAFQLDSGQFHRAVHKGDIKTIALLISGFSAISPYEEKSLQDKWMGTPLTHSPFTHYWGYGILIASLLTAILMLWGVTLRRLVKQRTSQLYTERTRLRTLLKSIPDLIWLTDKDGAYLSCNTKFEDFLGYIEPNMIGKCAADFMPAELAQSFTQMEQDAIATGTPCSHQQWLAFASDGHKGLFETVSTPVYNSAGNLMGVLGIARDITMRHHAEEQLRLSEKFFETLARINPVGIARIDTNNKCVFVNQRWCDISGLSLDQVAGEIWTKGIIEADCEMVQTEWQASIIEARPFSLEYRYHKEDGNIIWVYSQFVATYDDANTISGYVGTITDITNKKASEEEIRYLAFYDFLTGLPNRRLLHERLQQALIATNRNQHSGAVLFIDLDNFKTLNDTLGHDNGDFLLQQTALILTGCVRDVDTVARLGGDEFVVVLEGLSAKKEEAAMQTELVGEKILAALNHNYALADQQHHSTASIGITLFGHQITSVEELLKQADLSMYQSKIAGRNTLRFFDPAMQAVVTARANMETDIRRGMQDNQFLLYYQPQVDDHGKLTGAECLIRWQHPQRGLVPPLAFISIAEETGLILPLGEWVLETACKQLVIWANKPETAHLALAVNVSSRQFRQANFAQTVLDLLHKTGANPHNLKLELTESLLLDNVENVIATMATLKAQGVGFSLDDFGTGYSSLSYLKRLPLDQLKIDQSFVRDILTDPDDAIIAKTIITLGQSLGLSVIAEGVETEEQRQFLVRQGCRAYQGYLFGRPLPIAGFDLYSVNIINEWASIPAA